MGNNINPALVGKKLLSAISLFAGFSQSRLQHSGDQQVGECYQLYPHHQSARQQVELLARARQWCVWTGSLAISRLLIHDRTVVR
jgi:hypothetical protein